MNNLKDFLNKGDRFAATNGMQLTEVREGYARAEMKVEKRHLNGAGVCQGGAYFTLADLAFAAVTNSRGNVTLGIQYTVTKYFDRDVISSGPQQIPASWFSDIRCQIHIII